MTILEGISGYIDFIDGTFCSNSPVSSFVVGEYIIVDGGHNG